MKFFVRFFLLTVGVCALIESRAMGPHWHIVSAAGIVMLMLYVLASEKS